MHSRASPKGANIGRCSYYTGGHSDGLLVYWSTGFYCFTHLPIYQSTHQPVYRHPMGVPFGGVPLRYWAIRRFVGQALLTLRLFKFAPSGTPQPARKYSNDRFGLKPAEGRPDAHRSHYRPAGSARYQKIGLTVSQLLRDARPPHEDVGLCKGVAFSDRNSEMGFFNVLPTRRWGYAKVSLSATGTAK